MLSELREYEKLQCTYICVCVSVCMTVEPNGTETCVWLKFCVPNAMLQYGVLLPPLSLHCKCACHC